MWKINPQPFIKNNRPLIFAHRGDSALIPENTMHAFKDAYQLDIDCIETDVHMTKDQNFVLFHDPNLERTTDGKGSVADYTLSELKNLDAGYNFQPQGSNDFPFRAKGLKIHSLEEILPLFPKVRFNIDIKSENPLAPEILAQELKELGVEDRVCVGSFHQKQIQRFRKYSKIATSAGPKEVLRFLLKFYLWRKRVSKLIESKKKPISYHDTINNQKMVFGQALPYYSLQIPLQKSIIKIVTPQFIEFAHLVGIAIHVWTINEAMVMKKLLQWNVDGIFTDKPRVLIKVWEQLQNTSEL